MNNTGLRGALRMAILALVGMLPAISLAGETTAKISHILLYEGGNLIYVYPVGGVSSPPTCHGGNGDYYSFSMSRPMGKEYLAALLTAYAKEVTVVLHGTGACSDQSVSETLAYFTIH